MCKILISIKPEFVESIMNGEKDFEFRKVECKRVVDKIIIYSTSPVMKVVGEADVEEVLVNSPEEIWEITEKKAGISKNFFDEYYKDKTKAVAYKLNNIKKYDEPLALERFGLSAAPQSFAYI
jgi:Uncharacterized conserved protein